MQLKVSHQAVLLIMHHEHGSKPVPHKTYMGDSGDLLCGYGHKLMPGEHVQMPLSRDKAQDLLFRDLQRMALWVGARTAILQQHQFDALCCWAYQAVQGQAHAIGQTLEQCKLLEHCQTGRFQLATAEFDNWVYARGRFSKKLAYRRLAEQVLFQDIEQVCSH